jgi:hypothetical protein
MIMLCSVALLACLLACFSCFLPKVFPCVIAVLQVCAIAPLTIVICELYLFFSIGMEDAHTTLLEVEDAEGTAFFAVYDGHGGKPDEFI